MAKHTFYLHLKETEFRFNHRRDNLYLEEVDFSLNQVLCESGKTPAYMYFPTTAIVSLLYMTEHGASSEVAVVGNDGAVGMSLFFQAAIHLIKL